VHHAAVDRIARYLSHHNIDIFEILTMVREMIVVMKEGLETEKEDEDNQDNQYQQANEWKLIEILTTWTAGFSALLGITESTDLENDS
jgi:hypothetical protein